MRKNHENTGALLNQNINFCMGKLEEFTKMYSISHLKNTTNLQEFLPALYGCAVSAVDINI